MINNLLDRLQKVKRTKQNEWVACCPVHDDSSPSLGIKLTDDGKILCHCFGCGAGGVEIMQAIGMSPEDLFPPREVSYDSKRDRNSKRVYLSADTVLQAITYEATIISLAACDIVNGSPISADDAKRVVLASERLHNAIEYVIS